jgi:Ala-tRNA(Pro) deacylase
MNMLYRCQRYLTEHGIRYSHSTHPPAYTAYDTASAERTLPDTLAKTVVYVADNGPGLLVLPADHMVDFGEVRRLLQFSQLRLAAESELAELFPECELGAMPPFGGLFGLPVLLDERIAAAEFMAFNAGTHSDVIRISVSDFDQLVNPLVAAFAIKMPLNQGSPGAC